MSEPRGRARGSRRALTHVGGAVDTAGDRALADVVARALDVAADETSTRAHVHGFHSYPARLHPVTARRLVEALSAPGGTVLDPFCGSGTVLVEARLAGRRAIGVDANPLAVELAWLKVRGVGSGARALVLEGAEKVAAHAEQRRKAKAGATRRYGPEDVKLFDPHVLLELDGLRAGLGSVRHPEVKRTLALVLSAILVKVSRQPGDTAEARGPRRLASGFTIRLFSAKAKELVTRLEELERALPRNAPEPVVRLGDARVLTGVADASVDAVVTSPPYAGNYDYLAHHAARLRWLGMDASALEGAEIGARRHLDRLAYPDAVRRWETDLGAALSAMARVLAPSGSAVLVMADTVVAARALYADDLARKLAPGAGLEVRAVGSQERPHFHGPTASAFRARPRREHAIVLRRHLAGR